MSDTLPRIYSELADWYQLLTAPEDYEEEAAFYLGLIVQALGERPRTLLELGCGSGNMATHYKRDIQATLTDVSPRMLELSQRQNADCEHVLGDMRSLRLGREFDAVLAHDAVVYMTSEESLRQAMETAFVHLRPGGVAVFAPDDLRDNFTSYLDSGGHDGDGRALRYMEWSWDPDPADSTYFADYAYLLHEDGQPTRTLFDQHTCGLFSRAEWLEWLQDVGFKPAVTPLVHSEVEPGRVEVFVAVKPATP